MGFSLGPSHVPSSTAGPTGAEFGAPQPQMTAGKILQQVQLAQKVAEAMLMLSPLNLTRIISVARAMVPPPPFTRETHEKKANVIMSGLRKLKTESMGQQTKGKA